MNNYEPHPAHYFISSVLFFIGEIARVYAWTVFGWTMYGLGVLSAMIISHAFVQAINYATRDNYIEREPEIEREPIIEPTTITYTEDASTKIFKLNASTRQLEQLSIGLIVASDPFSEKRWSGRGKPFSVNQFRDLRDEMVRRGLACLVNEKDPRQGYTLTRVGINLLKRYLPHSPAEDELTPIAATI